MLNSESNPLLKQAPVKSLVNRFQVKRTKKNFGAAQINNSTHLQQYALNEANENDERFSALSAKLNKFKKSHKKKTRQTSHQFDWKREFGELKESKRKAEQVAISCLSSLLEVMGEEDEENSVSVDIISEVSGIKNDMESGVGSAVVLDQVERYSQRLGELRNVLLVLREGRQSNNGDEGEEGGDAEKLIKPLFAEMILQSKEMLSKEGEELQEEFDAANREAKEARIAVMKAMQGGEHNEGELPDELENTFKKAGFGDNVEMELVKEEIMMKLREVKAEWKKSIEEIKEGGSSEASDVEGESFQTTFEKIVQQWERRSKQGGKKKLMERLKAELPDVSSQKLNLRLSQYNSVRMTKQKREDTTTNYSRKMKQVVEWGVKAIEATRVALVKRIEQEAVALVSSIVREDQLARLKVLREEREAARKVEEQQRKIEEEEARLVELALAEKKAEEHEKARKMVEEYKKELEKQKLEMGNKQKLMEEELEREKLERMEKNGERVVYREILNQERLRQVEHELELKKIAEKEKNERLSALAATVPYYEKILNAKADLDKTTVARENDFYEEDRSGLSDFQHGVGKLRSFTNEKVFSDVRFRLGNALRAAGIAQTAASRA
eukprot:CAMPEP_0118646102 /NCGR_PEP_ID=MMETSP0785-20121206/7863_1 /TAXON_ID=91992 /ORGANISM="Bolidomonas pacifica, Strain CCMP 1866" /LENGTH=613 /DNA_ID=CAMNT_0006538045 /DNA_START=88 /DNA_END=1925 /DNA_ORIENTATION=+